VFDGTRFLENGVERSIKLTSQLIGIQINIAEGSGEKGNGTRKPIFGEDEFYQT